MHCYIIEVTLLLIFLNPKYYQNEIWSNTSASYNKYISNIFLTQYWRLDTSSSAFYDFNETTIKQDLSIFRNCYSPFQKKLNSRNLT